MADKGGGGKGEGNARVGLGRVSSLRPQSSVKYSTDRARSCYSPLRDKKNVAGSQDGHRPGTGGGGSEGGSVNRSKRGENEGAVVPRTASMSPTRTASVSKGVLSERTRSLQVFVCVRDQNCERERQRERWGRGEGEVRIEGGEGG